MKTLSNITVFIAGMLLLLSACKTEPEAIDYEAMLLGDWEITKGILDGKEATEMMKGYHFEFMDNKKLATNFHPTERGERVSNWHMDNNQLVIENSGEEPQVFNIDFVGEEKVVLVTSIDERKITMHLNKVTENTPADSGDLKGSDKGLYQ